MNIKLKTQKTTKQFDIGLKRSARLMAFPFSPIDSPAVLHSMNTPHCVWGQYCLLEYIVLRIPPKILPALQLSLQNDDLITSYPDLNRAICCYLDVSMPRNLSYYPHSTTNQYSVFFATWDVFNLCFET